MMNLANLDRNCRLKCLLIFSNLTYFSILGNAYFTTSKSMICFHVSVCKLLYYILFEIIWKSLQFSAKTEIWKNGSWCILHDLIMVVSSNEPEHDKTNSRVCLAKPQISLGIRPVWSESSLSAWRNLGSFTTHWAHSKDWSDWVDAQTDPSLCWAHRSFCWFCHTAAQMSFCTISEGFSHRLWQI